MAAKKPAKKISPKETVHYRPGEWLGGLIRDQADAWGISRGDAGKRLAILALCRLEVDSHDQIDEIARIATGSFIDAVRQVHVEIVATEHQKTADESLSPQETRRQVVREVLERERLVHGVTIRQAEKRVKVKIRRTH